MSAPGENKRQPRLNALIKSTLSEYIVNELELPGMISLSSVDVAPNLRSANIWVSVYGAEGDEVLKVLAENAGLMRNYLGKVLFVRTIPKLKFILDPSEEYASEISKKLDEIEKNE